jgi:hypothetical protein
MKRLKTLVIGSGITEEDSALVVKSLKFFITELSGELCLGDDFAKLLTFEDVSARPQSVHIRDHGGEYGYVLTLGMKGQKVLERTHREGDLEVCHTMEVADWSGRGRDMIIRQLKGFATSWVQMVVEGRAAVVAETDTHEIDWILQNTSQFKRHIQLMVQNGRPHAVHFQEGGKEVQCIMRDATKRLRKPCTDVVAVVIEDLGVQEKIQENLEKNGYPKVVFMEIEEFMAHITSMCLQMSGKPAYIKVEPVDEPTA